MFLNNNPIDRPATKQEITAVISACRKGGVALFPTRVSYSLNVATRIGVEKIFSLKKRPPEKSCVILGTTRIFCGIADINRTIKEKVSNLSLPVGLIVNLAQNSNASALATDLGIVKEDGSIGVFMNLGYFAQSIANSAFQGGALIVGSSANLSGRGNSYQLEDVDRLIIAGSDVTIDKGHVPFQEFSCEGHAMASPIVDIRDGNNARTVRIGIRHNDVLNEIREKLGLKLGSLG